jgi:hypothetical protein
LVFLARAAFFLAAGFGVADLLDPLRPLKIVSQPSEYFFVEPACVTVTVNDSSLKARPAKIWNA